jgi:hypothetical protein
MAAQDGEKSTGKRILSITVLHTSAEFCDQFHVLAASAAS